MNSLDEMDLKVIINPVLAKKLVHKGFVIRDIKPSKDQGSKGSVFLFENTKELREALEKIRNEGV